jgi:DNA polymerase-1
MSTLPLLLLVDGSAVVYRAFYALPPLSSPAGIPTHAILGVASMLLKLRRDEAPAALGVAMDGPGPTRRHREFAAYKAQRPPMPETLLRQLPYIQRLLAALRIPTLQTPEEEADDVLGSAAIRAAALGYEVQIVTGDKDLLQVVGDRIRVRDPMKQQLIGPAEVEARFGVPPARVPDFLALTGDSSDNIPGVPGIGPKTARELLRQFGSLEALLLRAAEVARPTLRAALAQYAAQARFSLRLATIQTDLALSLEPAALALRPPDTPAVLALCRELGFSRLAEQFQQPRLGD